jgi:hypothetical protein
MANLLAGGIGKLALSPKVAAYCSLAFKTSSTILLMALLLQVNGRKTSLLIWAE